jgi:hypothetical protein
MIAKRSPKPSVMGLVTLVWLACAAAAGAAGPAVSVSAGTVVDRAPLREAPGTDAALVTTLDARTPVSILQRQGAWLQVETGGKRGWVRLLSVRTAAGSSAGDSGIGKLFAVATGQSTGNSVTTGVRGLDKESIRNAVPKPMELTKLEAWAASPNEADAFAHAVPVLNTQTVRYVAADGEPQ